MRFLLSTVVRFVHSFSLLYGCCLISSSLSLRMPFTNLEYGQMVFLYGYCNGNARATAREYTRRYPNRVPPSPATISSAYRRLCESG